MKPELRVKIDLHRHAARTFAASKGRLPKDTDELGAWLLEFTEELGQLLSRWQEAVADAQVTSQPQPSAGQTERSTLNDVLSTAPHARSGGLSYEQTLIKRGWDAHNIFTTNHKEN